MLDLINLVWGEVVIKKILGQLVLVSVLMACQSVEKNGSPKESSPTSQSVTDQAQPEIETGNFSQQKQNRSPSSVQSDLTIVTLNIAHAGDNNVNLNRIVNVLKDLDPDIIALQEVDNGMRRTNGVNQAKHIAKKLGMYYAFGTAYKFKSQSINGRAGRYGNAILSHFPIGRLENIKLYRGSQSGNLPGHKETRAALTAKIELDPNDPSYDVIFISTHLGIFHKGDGLKSRSAKKLLDFIRRPENKDQPSFLAGDLNEDISGLKSLNRFNLAELNISNLNRKWTFNPQKITTHRRSGRQLDYILVRHRGKFSVVGYSNQTSDKKASDHLPFSLLLQAR